MKKKKKLTKMKIAKINYEKLTKEKAPIKKDEENEGYITIDEDESQNPETHEEKNETPKFAQIPEEIKELAISNIRNPQIEYNLIKLREYFVSLQFIKCFSWVDHIVCWEIDSLVLNLLNKLSQMQTVKKLREPSKV